MKHLALDRISPHSAPYPRANEAPGWEAPGWSELWRKKDWWAVCLALWLALFTAADVALGFRPRAFAASFVLLCALSAVIFATWNWDQAVRYNMEPPLVGLLISNVTGLPCWLAAGFREEFYVKTGIVLLGATLPFTLILRAGPVAITLVVLWAIVMIFVLPLLSCALRLPAGVGRAWIGTSEFAAAQAYGGQVGAATSITGTPDQAIWSCTLIKVVGRMDRHLGAGAAGHLRHALGDGDSWRSPRG